MNNALQTTHNLDFLARPWHRDTSFVDFKVGTCHGLYCNSPEAYEILSIVNSEPRNGHLEDVLQWFEHACRRDKKALRISEFQNDRFRRHLLAKRGFQEDGPNVIKYFITN